MVFRLILALVCYAGGVSSAPAETLGKAVTLSTKVGPIRVDGYTKLLTFEKRQTENRNGDEAIKAALAAMRQSHCAIKSVGQILEDPNELKGIFGCV